ncbi:5'/3'-nucleotidase SurE [Pseudidiomarina terrestris]|uniref:5'-nucleotidase SurE n=1 Tax=Pseudidiomarina terrestris TaxID=2820060 RepID=A0AAW7QXN0_9GAMM|nr:MULTISPECIES: 5'/3'-nucleotidase SurE [unclassified Pseudidiomarina]MDN7123600.1 5'/3'-nucleotidase SurE [Pseudidiomarina sp. 1APP75-32.1]MDN7126610.1 5'/3'-nucleotidase SurE [Pseudidiomarina sp. 1APR75-33.1]MDN7128676.1 5'/3'-nucleotidase SurE [Pseudidiomarina sp. 1APR75-15]MDN7135065.1 5'/3'-nucleotidase SurE [Pseudidiomarina sp. 1ASP75-5]MDN7137736.1 5'/3'-nucleotidase SurE [Pseudidiomarina sp. 1ASP75-14]
MMKLLVSNDDGVHAPGIVALHKALNEIAQVRVIAPDRNCSGASNSLTLHNPLRVQRLSNGFYSLNGTPTDCVHLGTNSPLADDVDLVVSGINDGPNMGDDVLYSGTVAAAMEGRYMGFPAIAVSMGSRSEDYYDVAARVVADVVNKMAENPLRLDTILNINVPAMPYEDLKGIKVTRLGRRHRADTMVESADPFGRKIYWYGPIGGHQDDAEDTDFYAIREGYVSITPISLDMTARSHQDTLASWLNEK